MDDERTILIVDDAPMFLELESLFLARSGRVVTAQSGEEALVRARREAPHLILVDAYMPGLDGADVCRAVRADPELADTPIIALCSSDDAEERAAILRAGADDVLPKPIDRMALVESVQRFVRFAQVRGLPRAPFRAEVRLHDGATDWVGRARNLSRTGIFIEVPKELRPESEVTLEFDLPEVGIHVRPTAQVIWLEHEPDGAPSGVGLRFLALDGQSARRIDHWVHERMAPTAMGGIR